MREAVEETITRPNHIRDMYVLLQGIGAIAWSVALAGALTYFGISGFDKGYLLGSFVMMYYYAGLMLIEITTT